MEKYDNVQQVHDKIDEMSKFLDLKKYVRGEKNSLKQIRSYYIVNGWAYKHFHSQEGFVHFGISKGDTYSPEDLYYMAETVSKYIKKGDTVMELGFGQAANIMYLAKKHPDVNFVGVDLSPFKEKNPPKNIKTYQQDYSSIPQMPDNSVDVIYAIETIVHNTDKEKISKEATRILKPGGVMIIYDFALREDFANFDPKTQLGIELLSKGGAAAIIESVDALNAHYTSGGLELVSVTDFGPNILPDLKRMEQKAAKIMKRPRLAKFMFAVLPTQFVLNIILGYLGYDAYKTGASMYPEWILKKP